jgi:hypothetical protein
MDRLFQSRSVYFLCEKRFLSKKGSIYKYVERFPWISDIPLGHLGHTYYFDNYIKMRVLFRNLLIIMVACGNGLAYDGLRKNLFQSQGILINVGKCVSGRLRVGNTQTYFPKMKHVLPIFCALKK